MDTSPAASKIISGDLPIRTAKPNPLTDSSHEPEPQKSTEPPKSENTPEAPPEPRLRTHPTTTKFEDEVASTVGQAMAAVCHKKKRRNRRPKSKRGKVRRIWAYWHLPFG